MVKTNPLEKAGYPAFFVTGTSTADELSQKAKTALANGLTLYVSNSRESYCLLCAGGGFWSNKLVKNLLSLFLEGYYDPFGIKCIYLAFGAGRLFFLTAYVVLFFFFLFLINAYTVLLVAKKDAMNNLSLVGHYC